MKYSTKLFETLKSSWETLLQPFQVEPPLEQKVFFDIVTAYTAANRFYHNLEHIYQVLETIEQLGSLSLNFAAIQLSAWFHDVIYDSRAKENEEKSAEYAKLTLKSLKIPQATIAQVKNLILLTKNHQALAADIDSQIFLDADLAILGSSESGYRAYAQAIRQEYSWITDAEYRIGRKRVLQNFLQRDRIYLTPQMFTTLEKKARQNLRAEVAALSAG
jgi:predicted metal-dependent HD superfamily phosphohydrolase